MFVAKRNLQACVGRRSAERRGNKTDVLIGTRRAGALIKETLRRNILIQVNVRGKLVANAYGRRYEDDLARNQNRRLA